MSQNNFLAFNKGLSSDTRVQAQPPGTVPFSKNGIRFQDVNQNEPGFQLSAALIPYTPIGVIETSKFAVIFSTDNTNSAMGYYDHINDVYIPIANDANYPYKLGFKTDFPINGQSQKNYKGEVIVAFTDFNTFPKFMNCDTPVVGSLDDWRLFPLANIPTLVTNVVDGGTLLPGAYYVVAKVIKNDGTETQYLVTSDVVVIPGTPDTNTGKAIKIELSDLDPDYNLVQVGIISKISGVISAFTLDPVPIGTGGKASLTYTGVNISTEATLEELLIEPVIYSKAKTIGQLNDAMYIGNLVKDPEPQLQKYMLLARIEFVSNLINVSPRNEDHASGKLRSFMHFEAYAFYIRLSKRGGGGWTQLYHIPGQKEDLTDTAVSTEGTFGGITMLKYQAEDTIRAFDATNKTGIPGTWLNQNENYPNTDDYDASSIGGQDLRGHGLLHHRMPSLRWCKEHFYSTDGTYGKDKLDMLGIRVSNIVIPAQYQNILDGGYEIYYAKRSIANSTVIAQSTLLFAARHGSGAGTRTITGPDTDYKTTGGNWHSQVDWDGNTREHPLVIDMSLFRFHAFDLLVNQPSIAPDFMRQELLLHLPNMPMVEDFTLTGGSRDAPISFLIDYIKDGSPPIISASGTLIRGLSKDPAEHSQYAPANLISGRWYNVMAETAFVGKLAAGPVLNITSDFSYNSLWTGASAQPPDKSAQFETCYLSNLCNSRTDMYVPFNGQSVVRVAARQTAQLVPLYGGDVFLCDYTFNTYGWLDYTNSTYSKDAARDPYMGCKAARRFACEAASNIYNRFEIPGNIYSKWYPNSSLTKDDNNMYLNLFDRRIDPNQIGYSKDSNALNDIITVTMFNPLNEDITLFPFRIHRSGKLNRQLKKRSWRTFLPLDYYEMQKNMDVIEHLEGMDDRLLIHCRNALFFTQPKMNLEQGSLAVVIGNGDIFQFEPQETYSDKLGYAGNQHNLGSYRTPAGYIFTDTEHGEIFLFRGELKIITQGLSNFFIDHMRIKENNPFIGNGITIGYDQEYRRILLTCKNRILPTGVKELQQTQQFIDSLTPGESLVTDKGRLMRFLGVSEVFQCVDTPAVQVGDIVLTTPEDTPAGQVIHTIIPIAGSQISYFVISGNLDNAISIAAATGQISISNPAAIAYATRHQLIVQARAVAGNGTQDDFSITINITKTNKPPVSGPQQFIIPENTPNSTLVGTVPATDPNGAPLSYSITAGNDQGAFVINSVTGKITVADSTKLDFETNPVFLLTVSISNGFAAIAVPVKIILTNVDEAPPLNDDTITIYDTTPTATQVYKFSTVDPEGDLNLLFEIVNASTPGVFALDSATGAITLINNSYLDAISTPQYTIRVRVSDSNRNSDEGVLTINVVADPETIEFRPANGSCSGGCPDGYSPTDDGLYCQKLTVIPATPPSGGAPVTVRDAANSAYSDFGAAIYQPGFSQNGVGTVQQWMQQPVWRNIAANLTDGPMNRCGVWGSTFIPNNEPVGFSIPVTIPAATTFYIAVAGDNACKIAVDGVIIIDQDPVAIGASLEAQLGFTGQGIQMAFKMWHIYPVTLAAGTRYIGLEGVNYGAAAGFGAEIYKNTIPELQAAVLDPAYVSSPGSFPLGSNYYTNLDLVFTTRSTRGGTFSSGITSGYSCPATYAMDGSTNPPTCVLVERLSSTTRIWASIQVYSYRSSSILTTLSNTAGQTFQGIPVPTFPPVNDHIDCGGTKTLYLNTPIAEGVTKNDCPEGLGSVVRYAVPGGKYTSLSSQADADAQAKAELDANKQTYANDNGFCINQNH